ncbi:response regulator transcription factor [Streptomyces sp. NBC_00648]|uniref:response regulator n=1 Tax=Streptomyces sp. NBC_00648 TaxID=2975797 RepID=UPI00324822EC
MRVVASDSGVDAVAVVTEHWLDVVLLDIQMPDLDGLGVLRQLKALANPPAVVMLTSFGPNEYIHRALAGGAADYRLKDADPE